MEEYTFKVYVESKESLVDFADGLVSQTKAGIFSAADLHDKMAGDKKIGMFKLGNYFCSVDVELDCDLPEQASEIFNTSDGGK